MDVDMDVKPNNKSNKTSTEGQGRSHRYPVLLNYKMTLEEGSQ